MTMPLFSRFEVDTLEIVLQELLGLVDTFFLVESDRTHRGVRRERESRVRDILTDGEASDLGPGEGHREVPVPGRRESGAHRDPDADPGAG